MEEKREWKVTDLRRLQVWAVIRVRGVSDAICKKRQNGKKTTSIKPLEQEHRSDGLNEASKKEVEKEGGSAWGEGVEGKIRWPQRQREQGQAEA